MITLIGGAFQDSLGNTLKYGYLILTLTNDTVVATANAQIVGAVSVTVPLDGHGNVVSGTQIWSNAELTPSGTAYNTMAFSETGVPAWKNSQNWVFVTAAGGTIDVGTMVPTSNSVAYPGFLYQQGAQGIQGPQGTGAVNQGPQGPRGYQGFTGITGPQGTGAVNQGPQGPSGALFDDGTFASPNTLSTQDDAGF